MKNITALVELFLQQTEHAWQLQLAAQWPTIMGDLARRARLERVVGTQVVIGVYDSHWMHELHALSRMIIYRINTALKDAFPSDYCITALRCVWVQQVKRATHATQPRKQELKTVSLTQTQFDTVQDLPSSDLRQALLDYYIRCRQQT